jgi:hypothetical protein
MFYVYIKIYIVSILFCMHQALIKSTDYFFNLTSRLMVIGTKLKFYYFLYTYNRADIEYIQQFIFYKFIHKYIIK